MSMCLSYGKVLAAGLRRPALPMVFSFLIGATPLAAPVFAQIIPDETLGSEASTVTPDALVQGDLAELIEGGAIRDTNLFHSFSDFNVETLQRVYFANPAGIDTILTRVTGGNGSSIDGTLGVDGLADLYLLNPNGIAFGPNAQLDIRGSFVASTANSWNLGDGLVFSAVDPEAPPLLAVTLTPGLQYGTAPQADITNEGNLVVDPGDRLILLGDTVTHTGTLTAPGGTAQLLGNRVGVFDAGRIDVSASDGGGTINLGGGFQGQGPLPRSQQTAVGPDAALFADATVSGDAGEIIVWSDGLTRFYGSASAVGGATEGNGGFVEVSGLQQLVYEGQVNTSAINGEIGTLLLDPTNVRVVDDAIAEPASFADVDEFDDPNIDNDGDTLIAASIISGSTSNVVLQATETISFETLTLLMTPSVGIEATAGESISVTEPIVTSGGAISLTAPDIAISSSIASAGGDISIAGENSVLLNNSAVIESGDVFSGVSDAGRVSVNTIGNLTLTEGSQIRAGAVLMGSGGNIDVSAGSISLSGTGLSEPSGILSLVSPGTFTSGGDVTVVADNISLADGATISTQNQGGGVAGFLSVRANQRLDLDGSGTNIGAPVFSTGTGGDVEVIANNISVTNGATIASSTFGDNETGSSLSVTAEEIELDGFAGALGSGIGSNVFASGRGANITVDASEIIITNGALISTSTFDDGDDLTINDGAAGNLSVSANQIEIDGFFPIEDALTGEIVDVVPSGISSDVRASGPGGDVIVEADNIFVTDGAVITTSSTSSGAAGSLSVTAQQVIELDGFVPVGNTPGARGIASNVFASGDGGDVIVDATDISVNNGATISIANVGNGASGNLFVTAEQLEIDGFASSGTVVAEVSSVGSDLGNSGSGGDIVIDADNIAVTNGAVIRNRNRGDGEVGSLLVAANQIELEGAAVVEGVAFGSSGINSEVFASGDSGDVTIETTNLSIIDGATISTANAGTGTAGNVFVVADQIEVDGFAANENTVFGVSGNNSEEHDSGAGGDVTVKATDISISNGALISTSNSSEGKSGDLSVTANNEIEVDGFVSIGQTNGFSGIVSIVQDSGDGGNVSVEASRLTIIDGANISTTNVGEGTAGSLSVVADQIEVNGFASIGQTFFSASAISSVVQNSGDGGDVIVEADDLTITNGANISTSNFGAGIAGDLSVTGNKIEVVGFASIGQVLLGSSGLGSQVFASGAGGNVKVDTASLVVADGATVSTSNASNEAAAGSLLVTADQLELDSFGSLTSEVFASGTGGNVIVGTDDSPVTNISVANGARISTITSGLTDAADVIIQVEDEIELDGGLISSASNFTNANSGDVFLDAGALTLRNGSSISAGTFAVQGIPNASEAAAGEVDVTAERIFLDRSVISTTGNLGDGGNLFVEASDFLLLRNNSQISTTAGLLTSGGDGGNIIVDAPFVVGVLTENSDITANAFLGDGGTVTVTALDIIGLEFQDALTPFSDITASSEVGNAGITEFDQLTDVNPEDSLDEIPIDLTDPTSLIDRQCALQATPTASEFTVVGRGGLPIDPSQPSIGETFLEDLGAVPEPTDTTHNQGLVNTPDEETASLIQEDEAVPVIREAQGWIQDDSGRTYLVSATPQGITANYFSLMTCQHPNETGMLELQTK